MPEMLTSEDKAKIIDLFGMAHTIELRLKDIEEVLELDSDVQQAIQQTILKANSLLVALGYHLTD